MSKFNLEKHLFICTNERDGKKSCEKYGAKEYLAKIKEEIKKDPQLKKKFKVTKSGCLGLCSKGIAAVLYPEGQWMTEIQKKDSPKKFYKKFFLDKN